MRREKRLAIKETPVLHLSDLYFYSVVIIFTNEAWSPLIRTIYSVLNKVRLELLSFFLSLSFSLSLFLSLYIYIAKQK